MKPEEQTKDEFVELFAKEVLGKKEWYEDDIPYWVENMAENLYYAGFRKIEK
jgi:hypothetical protein